MMSFPNKTFFWTVSAKELQQSLIYTPASDASPEEVLSLVVRDCDGEEVNKAEIIFPTGRCCVFELEYLLGLMKHQSGMRHGLVQLESQSAGRLLLRYQYKQNASFVPAQQTISNVKQGLIPINNFGERRTLLVLSNCDEASVQVRGKILLGKRSPEVAWDLPPYSSRIFDLNYEFASSIGDGSPLPSGRGYLRLSTSTLVGVLMHSLVYDSLDDSSETLQIF